MTTQSASQSDTGSDTGSAATSGGEPAIAPTLQSLAADGARTLARAGIDTPGLDARVLLAAAAGLDQARLIVAASETASPDIIRRFAALLARRTAREPVSRILGAREFYGRTFALSPAVLDPRADTETVIEAALAAVAGRKGAALELLDLGTGSGAILVTLLAELASATGLGVDIDPHAIAVARANARRHGVADRARFCVADWTGPLTGEFDLIVANPPYIETAEIEGLAPEVRGHDPAPALDGGADGLAAHRAIAARAGGLLARDGVLVMEFGAGQAAALELLLSGHGFAPAGPGWFRRDLAGRPRVIAACKA